MCFSSLVKCTLRLPSLKAVLKKWYFPLKWSALQHILMPFLPAIRTLDFTSGIPASVVVRMSSRLDYAGCRTVVVSRNDEG